MVDIEELAQKGLEAFHLEMNLTAGPQCPIEELGPQIRALMTAIASMIAEVHKENNSVR
jgi:hypothetical protein